MQPVKKLPLDRLSGTRFSMFTWKSLSVVSMFLDLPWATSAVNTAAMVAAIARAGTQVVPISTISAEQANWAQALLAGPSMFQRLLWDQEEPVRNVWATLAAQSVVVPGLDEWFETEDRLVGFRADTLENRLTARFRDTPPAQGVKGGWAATLTWVAGADNAEAVTGHAHTQAFARACALHALLESANIRPSKVKALIP